MLHSGSKRREIEKSMGKNDACLTGNMYQGVGELIASDRFQNVALGSAF
jgi:hypothetical protein